MKRKSLIKAERPGGLIDYLPDTYLARQKIIKKIEKAYQMFGFDPIETPIIEFTEVLAGETSDTGKNIFQIVTKNRKEAKAEKPLALRFDLTVPFARLLSANPYQADSQKGIKLPWRRMVVGPVFRAENPQSGRYRQFYQFDADIAGSASLTADTEIILMMIKTLLNLDIQRFQIQLNNRKILNGLSELVGLKPRKEANLEDLSVEMMRILDKLDKIGLNSVLSELTREPENDFDFCPSLTPEGATKIKSFLEIEGANKEKLDKCSEIFQGIKIAQEGIEEMREINRYLREMNIPEEQVAVNFSIARGLDYYTGTVLETVLLDAPQFGSVLSGGRYNDLVSRFTGQELPAVGASIGIDRLFAALEFLGKIDLSQKTVTDVMILRIIPGQDLGYLKIAQEIRDCDLNCEICLLEDTTFRSQFNFAINRGVKYVVIFGENEKINNTIQIKNLVTREQREVPLEDLQNFFNKLKDEERENEL